MTEGRLPFRGNEVWFRVVGDDHAKPPILLIHGGPGSTSDILEPLADLAASGRQVVFYDQLGAGRSDRTHNPALWTIDTFVDEVQAVRDHLGLDELHLFGHSWGGMLALEYALRQPAGLRSLVLASALVSASLFAAEADRLLSDLPASWQRALARTAHQAPKTVEPRPAEPPIPRGRGRQEGPDNWRAPCPSSGQLRSHRSLPLSASSPRSAGRPPSLYPCSSSGATSSGEVRCRSRLPG